VLPQRVCVLPPDRRLKLWAPGDWQVRVDGAPVESDAEHTGDLRIVVVPEGASELVLQDPTRRWALPLTDAPPSPRLAELDALRAAGRCEEASARSGDDPNAAMPVARCWIARSQWAEARGVLTHALAQGAPEGRLRAWLTLLLVETLLRDPEGNTAIRPLLDGLSSPAPDDLDFSFMSAYTRCRLERHTANPRAAIPACEEAARRARQTADLAREREATDMLGAVLGQAGQHAEALARMSAIPTPDEACARAAHQNNLAWAVLAAVEAGHPTAGLPDPAPLLREASLTIPGCEREASRRANLEVNLALAEEQAGHLDAAREAVAGPNPNRSHEQELWAQLVRARVLLRQGDVEGAAGAFRALSQLADRTLAIDMAWRARDGVARTQRARGQLTEAVATWQEAMQLTWRLGVLVPTHLGRDAFLQEQERAVRPWVDTLVTLGRAAEALEVTRELRSAMVRGQSHAQRLATLGPEELAEWDRLMADSHALQAERAGILDGLWSTRGEERAAALTRMGELAREAHRLLDHGLALAPLAGPSPPRTPDPGELILAWFPTDTDWLGFAQRQEGVVVRRLGPIELPASDAALAILDTFTEDVREASLLTLLVHGRLAQVDIHRLPFDGAPLQAGRPVRYALDLPQTGTQGVHVRSELIVIADPRVDLPGARREGEAVSAAARAPLLLGDSADRAGVLRAMREAGALYFAGHARFAQEPWESALLLAGDTELSVADVLTLYPVPDLVVLSGCNTATTQASTMEGTGLAQSFLAAGASAVVATTRAVDDQVAGRLGAALVQDADWASHPERALRHAQQLLRTEQPEADWAAWRILIP
jgi:tetratricopeptide (TPR) repeat protein